MNNSHRFYGGNTARGSFRAALFAALGGAPATIEPGRFQRFPTSQRPGDQAGWCKLFPDELAGVFGDHRSGYRSTWQAAAPSNRHGVKTTQVAHRAASAFDQQRRQWVSNMPRLKAVWSEAKAVTRGDLVDRYLLGRGIELSWPAPPALRTHPGLGYWQGDRLLGYYPAMLAAVTSPEGQLVALHRTYLCNGARKADVASPKKLSKAAGPLAGAGIVLGSGGSSVVGVAEGIETALAAHAASGIATDAAYCAGNLAAWSWPSCARRLVVFADNDACGLAAARTLAARALAAGLLCDLVAPSTVGADWCDVWALRQRAGHQQGDRS